MFKIQPATHDPQSLLDWFFSFSGPSNFPPAIHTYESIPRIHTYELPHQSTAGLYDTGLLTRINQHLALSVHTYELDHPLTGFDNHAHLFIRMNRLSRLALGPNKVRKVCAKRSRSDHPFIRMNIRDTASPPFKNKSLPERTPPRAGFGVSGE